MTDFEENVGKFEILFSKIYMQEVVVGFSSNYVYGALF